MYLFFILYIIVLTNERIKDTMKKTREAIIKILERDTTRERIFKLCRDNGLLQETAKVVDLFLDNTMEEVAEIMQIDVRTVQRKINKFIDVCGNKLS